MGRQVFTAGEILTAANMNDLSDQSVMVFDDATARATAIPTPVEGMVTYLKDTDEVEKFDGTNFVPVIEAEPPTISQVVQTVKTNVFSAFVAEGARTAITGLTAAITPSATSSKVLVFVEVSFGFDADAGNPQSIRLTRNGTGIGVGDSFESRRQESSGGGGANRGVTSGTIIFLDAPNTTSSVTYGVDVSHARLAGTTVVVNRPREDFNQTGLARYSSTITVMEVAG